MQIRGGIQTDIRALEEREGVSRFGRGASCANGRGEQFSALPFGEDGVTHCVVEGDFRFQRSARLYDGALRAYEHRAVPFQKHERVRARQQISVVDLLDLALFKAVVEGNDVLFAVVVSQIHFPLTVDRKPRAADPRFLSDGERLILPKKSECKDRDRAVGIIELNAGRGRK